ncbi:MAG: glycosyltransferase family 2 protein, partial [Candidatus Aenigmarchaeota archaeon]|nr:glycosyltransferase family 2 protein [Candidatus Aenigmarchaeota archaeon]
MSKDTVIIILNYNKPELTFECINNILLHEKEKVDIMVIDNGSNKEYSKVLKDNLLKLDFCILNEYKIKNFSNSSNNCKRFLILLSKNLGYAKGNNIGLKLACRMGYKYAIVMNNDVVIEKPIIDKLKEIFNKSKNVALVAPRLLGIDGKDQSPSITPCFFTHFWLKAFYPLTRYIYWKILKRIKNELAESAIKELDENLYPQGSFLMVHLERLKTVGFFDETTFLFSEEPILVWKLRKKGFK